MLRNIGIRTFEGVVSSPRLYKFALAGTVLYQSDQLGVLDMSAGNVLGRWCLLSGRGLFFLDKATT